jgi:hypothetical protein
MGGLDSGQNRAGMTDGEIFLFFVTETPGTNKES